MHPYNLLILLSFISILFRNIDYKIDVFTVMNCLYRPVNLVLLHLEGELKPNLIQVNLMFQFIFTVYLIGRKSGVSVPKEYE